VRLPDSGTTLQASKLDTGINSNTVPLRGKMDNPSIAAYDAFATGGNAAFDRLRASRSATEADVVRVIFAAASDRTDQLRYGAAENIKPLARVRRETPEREYMAFMGSRFLPKP
jgi:hypothetical protein